MINRVEADYGEDGRKVLRLFEENGGLVGSVKTIKAAKYVFDMYGGPAPQIMGEIPDTHENFWQKVCDAL